MVTFKRRWRESRRGGTAVVKNADINGSSNPFVGAQLGHYRSRANDELEYGFVAVCYLIEEYGDDAIEAVSEMSKEEQKEYVGAVETRIADDNEQEPDPRDALDLGN